mmetsp:Transcript_23168/g.32638  ORF Transcript_23168/g.32638 Transcript_23168/m.32638 type:complete len:204 (+) Transcript_23168:3-614(+)
MSENQDGSKSLQCKHNEINFTSADEPHVIDKEVLSQLPRSIQSEIRVASMSNIGKKSRPNNSNEKSIQCWFKTGPSAVATSGTKFSSFSLTNDDKTNTNKSVLTRNASPSKAGMKRKSTLDIFLLDGRNERNTNCSPKFPVSSETRKPRKDTSLFYTHDTIDPHVLNELPESIRSAILDEVGANKLEKIKKVRAINSFFSKQK